MYSLESHHVYSIEYIWSTFEKGLGLFFENVDLATECRV
jgi:hypothetical protein